MSIPFRALTPFVHVNNMPSSIAFYERLGFTIKNTLVPDGFTEPVWAALESGDASLMLAQAEPPIDAAVQGVLFYAYVEDVRAKQEELRAAGVTVGNITTPFYAPRGEFRVEDPDGYVVMITHT